VIFDVWFLPWLIDEDVFRIWLDAPLDVRVRRVERQLDEPSIRDDVWQAVSAKDQRARDYGLLHYGIDIYRDRDPFDVVFDTACAASPGMATKLLSRLCGVAFLDEVPTLQRDEAVFAKTCLIRCPGDAMVRLGLK
jgi:cytidylate kinase